MDRLFEGGSQCLQHQAVHGVFGRLGQGNMKGDVVFQKRTSLVFKKLQVVRFYDAKRNALVYLTYSDKIVDGSPKNAISAVPIMPWNK